MDASTKRLRSHIQSKARTNRTNRVQRTANQYKGGKLSKSQQAYIDNDLKSTSSMREYGYKQAKDFKGVTYYTGGRSRQNYEKLQNGYNPYQTRYYISNHQDRNYVPGGISKSTGKAYNGFYTNKHLLNKNQFGTLFTQGNLTQQAQDRVATSKDRLDNYSILRPFNANAKNFGQTLNTGVLDGLRVAQNRINKGGSKLNYVGGLAKDILVDPLVDLLKTFDRYESSALNAGLGGIQSITELADALTKKSTKLSDVNWNHARDNWQHSIETSNKEGFGDSAGESIKKIVKGTQERQLKEYKQGGNSLTNWWESKFDAKHKPGDYKGLQYQRDLHTDKNKKADELGSFVNGLILDILNPVQIGSSVMKGSSALLKKSGKEIKNGYKAGIVSDPEGLEWLNNITKKTTDKFRNGKSGAKHVDDIMHETEDAYNARRALMNDDTRRVTAQMDNEYARQVAKADNGVKKVIDANPNTQNLSKFIDEIDASNSKQMNFWKRIRKNKRVTKDGYVPQLNHVDDVLEDTKNIEQVPGQINIKEIQNRPQQLDMFDQLGLSSEERFVPNSKNIAEQVQKELHPSTEKTIQQTMEEFLDYGDERKMTNLMKMLDENGEDVFKYIDELDDYHTDRMLDYLERYEPELYNKYINNIDELIDGTSNEKAMRTYQDEQAVKNIIKKPEIRNTDAIDKEYFKNSNEAYELEKIFKDNKNALNMTEIRHKKSAFTSHINEYVQRIENGDIQLKAVDSLTKRLKNANIPKSEKIKFINNNLFNGNKVISENASMKSVNSFLESLEDVHKVIQNKLDFNAGVIDNFDLNNLSKNTQNFLKNLKDTGIEGMPNEVAESIVNRSMPLIDEQFNTKMSYLAHKFGYESIDDLRREVSQLKARRKELDNYRKTKDVIEEQTSLSARIKELNNTIDARDVEWNKIKGMNEGQLQKYLIDNDETEFLASIKNPKFNNDFLNKQVDVERDMRELGEQYADKARENSTGNSIKKDYLQDIYKKTQEQAKDMTTGIYREYVNKMAEIEKYYDNISNTIRRANIDRVDTKYLNTDVPEYIIQYQKDLEALEQTPEVMRKLGLSNPKYKTSNATYHKSVNRGKLPEVQQNLNALKHLIEQEANIATSNQKGYEQISDALLAIKRDYVNAIRSYGVDTKLIKDNANEYLQALVNAQKNPLKKINLQMLANKISDDIEEITKPTFKTYDEAFNTNRYIIQDGNIIDNETGEIINTVENFRLGSKDPQQILEEYKDVHPDFKTYDEAFNNEKYIINDGNIIDSETGEVIDTVENFNLNPNKRNPLTNNDVLEQIKSEVSPEYYDRAKDFMSDDKLIDPTDVKNVKVETRKTPLDEIVDKPNKNITEHLKNIDVRGNLYITEKGTMINKQTGEIVGNVEDYILNSNNPELYLEQVKNKLSPKQYNRIKKIISPDIEKTPLDEVSNVKKEKTPIEKIKIEQKPNPQTKQVKPEPKKQPKPETKPTFKTYDEAFGNDKIIIDDGNIINKETGEVLGRVEDAIPDARRTSPEPTKPVQPEPKTKQVNNPQPNQPTKPQTKKVKTNQQKQPKKSNNKNIEINRRKNNNPIYDLYKRYLNTWKKGVTVYNPGWHLQNFLQNKGQNYLALGTDAFGSQKQARKMLDYIKGLSSDVDDIVMNNGVKLSGKDMADFAKQTGVAQGAQATQIMQEPRTLMPWLDEMIDNTKLMKRLSRNEETARLHHYLTQLKRGMSPDEAVQSVNKYLFDYGHKTNRERFIEDYIDPFYVFHKSYAKLLGKEALTNPSKINNILRMEREMTNSTPEISRNQNASDTKFQLPFGSFTDEDNNARYDYMAKQYVFPEIQSALPLTYDDLEGKLNPLLKLAIQQMRGKGDFDTKIVDKNKAGWNEITKDDRKKEILMDVNPFVNNLPTTINKVNKVNDRKQSKKTSDIQKMELIFNYLTGNKGKHERYLDFLK